MSRVKLNTAATKDLPILGEDVPKWVPPLRNPAVPATLIKSQLPANEFAGIPSLGHQVLTELRFMFLVKLVEHLSTYASIHVACRNAAGELVWVRITLNNIIINQNGPHEYIEFKHSQQSSCSFLATPALHLPSRVGKMDKRGNKFLATVPAKSVPRTACNIKEQLSCSNYAVQFRFRFDMGKSAHAAPPADPVGALSFAHPLGLATVDKVNTTIKLYGYWLSDGTMDRSSKILFYLTKPQDVTYLDNLFKRLKRVLPPSNKNGMTKVLMPSSKTVYTIKNQQWVEYFRCAYQHKYVKLFGHNTQQLKYLIKPKKPVPINGLPFAAVQIPNTPFLTLEAEFTHLVKWCLGWVGLELNPDQIKLFLQGLRFADGNESQGTAWGGSIFTSSERFCDQVVLLAILAGYSVIAVHRVNAGYSTPATLGTTTAHGWSVNYATSTNVTNSHGTASADLQCVDGPAWSLILDNPNAVFMVRQLPEVAANGVVPHTELAPRISAANLLATLPRAPVTSLQLHDPTKTLQPCVPAVAAEPVATVPEIAAVPVAAVSEIAAVPVAAKTEIAAVPVAAKTEIAAVPVAPAGTSSQVPPTRKRSATQAPAAPAAAAKKPKVTSASSSSLASSLSTTAPAASASLATTPTAPTSSAAPTTLAAMPAMQTISRPSVSEVKTLGHFWPSRPGLTYTWGVREHHHVTYYRVYEVNNSSNHDGGPLRFVGYCKLRPKDGVRDFCGV
ncbi:hypothetical protein H9P43_007679 [Blastocladiella emersonii ATCC 22665]|nr:hypothetical protein H9P43_007679 [Blastocladiella emersonii ATCC 22665]